MKGYRTLAVNAAAVVVAIAGYFGVVISPELANELALAVLAVGNIGLRLITDTKAGVAK